MLTETASGVFTIAVTPFTPEGALDLDSVDRMVDFYLEKGATGLTLLGMMGEAEKLSADEAGKVVQRVLARTSVPIVVGVSAPGFAAMQALTQSVMDMGAAGVMIAPPHTLRTDAQIFGYYQAAAGILGDVPFVLQDFPQATGVVIAPEVISRIVAACPTCVMLKHEDWPGLDKISAIRRAEADGARRISILCGNGGLYLVEEMLRGADGAMTGFSYPEMMAQVVAGVADKDADRARDIFDAYLPLARYELQPGLGLAIRKHILASRGAISSGALRTPGRLLSKEAVQEIDVLRRRQSRALAQLGLPHDAMATQ